MLNLNGELATIYQGSNALPSQGKQTMNALTLIDDFLSDPSRSDDCFNRYQLQGALTSTLTCPEVISDIDVGFMVLDEDEEGAGAWFALDGDVRKAWVAMSNEISDALAYETFSLHEALDLPLNISEPTDTLCQWCDGYLRGYLLSESAWMQVYEELKLHDDRFVEMEEEHLAFLGMVAALAEWENTLASNENPAKLQQNFPELLEAINGCVGQFHALALALEDAYINSKQDASFESDIPKIGRNDPCPCGSGKKYKKCCLQ